MFILQYNHSPPITAIDTMTFVSWPLPLNSTPLIVFTLLNQNPKLLILAYIHFLSVQNDIQGLEHTVL